MKTIQKSLCLIPVSIEAYPREAQITWSAQKYKHFIISHHCHHHLLSLFCTKYSNSSKKSCT